MAAYKGDYITVQLLLDNYADVNVKDKVKVTLSLSLSVSLSLFDGLSLGPTELATAMRPLCD